MRDVYCSPRKARWSTSLPSATPLPTLAPAPAPAPAPADAALALPVPLLVGALRRGGARRGWCSPLSLVERPAADAPSPCEPAVVALASLPARRVACCGTSSRGAWWLRCARAACCRDSKRPCSVRVASGKPSRRSGGSSSTDASRSSWSLSPSWLPVTPGLRCPSCPCGGLAPSSYSGRLMAEMGPSTDVVPGTLQAPRGPLARLPTSLYSTASERWQQARHNKKGSVRVAIC